MERLPNHDKWIDVLSIDWGAHKPGGGATGQARNPAEDPTIRDLAIVLHYEKSSPKLMEACVNGQVFPEIVLEELATRNGRQVYLRYELKNVMITSFQVNASGNDEAGPPTVVVGNNFEEVKVTYTEFDDTAKKDEPALGKGDDKNNDTPKAKKKNKKGKKAKNTKNTKKTRKNRKSKKTSKK